MRQPIYILAIMFFVLMRAMAQSGPVGYYYFNNNTADSSGYSNHGTGFSTLGASDRFLRTNRALSFNGTTSYVSVPHNNVFNSDSGITIGAWVFPAAFSTGQYLIQKASTTTGGYSIRIAANRVIVSVGPTLSPTEVQSSAVLSLNDWYHITLLYNGSALKLFINGTLDNTVSAVKSVNSTAGITLGKSSSGNFLNGRMDDIRLYRRTLSDVEIAAHYSQGGYGTVTYEGKVYHTVQIGSQYWMRENLDVGTMINGSQSASNNGSVEKYCYDNSPINCTSYGGLYQWDEAMGYSTTPGVQGICPSGWRVPTKNDYQILQSAVGGDGNSLKAAGQGSGGGAGTNESGFAAMLAGARETAGTFSGHTSNAFLWTSLQQNSTLSDYMALNASGNNIELANSDGLKQRGMSVRCVRSDAPMIIVTFPNGGEQLPGGGHTNITWTSNGITNVKIELSTNAGTSWSIVAASVPSTAGSYLWAIPAITSTNCKIRISDAANALVHDESNGIFTISNAVSAITVVIRCNSVWADTNYNGFEIDTLDGSGSSSTSGTISNYQWYINGIASNAAPKITAQLATGTNWVKLKLTTSFGDTASAEKRVDVFVTKMPTQGSIYGAVSEVNKMFFVTSLDSTVYKFDSTAANPAHFTANGPIVSTVCISKYLENGKNLIYFGTENGTLYCLNSDLQLIWMKQINESGITTPAVSGDGLVVCAGTKGGKFVALNALNGNYLYQLTVNGGVLSSPVVLELSNNTRVFYFGSCGNVSQKPAIYAIRNISGTFFELFWRREMESFTDSIQSSPAVLEDGISTMIYVGAHNGYLYRTRWDGEYATNWRVNLGGAVISSPIIDGSHIVYAASNSGTLNGYPWDFTENTPPAKHFATSSGLNGSPSLGADGTIFVGSDNGTLFALNSTSEKTEMTVNWSFADSIALKAPTLITERGNLFVGDLYGKVYVFADPMNLKNNGDIAKVTYKWPTYKGNNYRSQTSTLTTPPPAPQPQCPVDSALSMNGESLLMWIKEESAETYWLQVSKTPDFSLPDYSDSTLTTSYKSVPLESGTTYYWRVSGANGYGRGAWSDTMCFTTAGGTAAKLQISKVAANGGESVLVPVQAKNITALLNMTLKMNIDTSLLTFSGITNKHSQLSSMSASQSGTSLTVTWSGASSVNIIDAKLFDLQFVYNGADFPTPVCLLTKLKNCPLINSSGDTLDVDYTDGLVSKKPSVLGKVLYNNNALTPVTNSWTKLKSGSTAIDSSLTDAAGAFAFQDCSSGSYSIEALPSLSWGGVTATDALKVRRHYTTLEVLSGLKLQAADVNRSSAANSTDGLLIKRRVVGLTDTAWTAGDWVTESPSLDVEYSNVNRELKVMCAGDVNASYTPPDFQKETECVRLEPDGSILPKNTGTVSLPLRAGTAVSVGALTLHIQYDKARFTLESVTSPLQDFLYNEQDGIVHFAWENGSVIEFRKDDCILTLHFMIHSDAAEDIKLTMREGSEAANVRGYVLPAFSLLYPSSAKANPAEFGLEQNYPNPFNPVTTIRYQLPVACDVRLELYNSIGERVATPVAALLDAGYHTVRWNGSALPSGPYIYLLTAVPADGRSPYRIAKKLLILK